MDIPKCFASARQYANWVEAASIGRGLTSGICTDCTPEYQAEMLAADRCEHPSVTFHPDEDGMIEGRRPSLRDIPIKVAA